MSDEDLDDRIVLTEQERHLIHMVRKLKYGELRIIITEGKPVRAEEIKKSIKL